MYTGNMLVCCFNFPELPEALTLKETKIEQLSVKSKLASMKTTLLKSEL